MTDTCRKCGRPSRSKQPMLVAEMSCLRTGSEKCRIASAAYQRGLEAGRAERPDISPEDASVYLRGPVRAAAGDAWFRANDTVRSALGARAAKVKR